MRLICVLGLALVIPFLGCADDAQDQTKGAPKTDVREAGGLDAHPEKLDGSESNEFEPEDIEVAGDAGVLIELYCEGASSEAQYEGCLSHVVEEDVCSQDTAAKRDAVTAYIDETGDEAICG